MATIPSTLSATNQALQAVNEHGWRRGFANLLRNENRMWWGTRKWLVHLLLWLIVLNGLVLLIGLTEGQETNNPVPIYETLIQVFFQVGAFATAIGVVTTAQGAIVREKQLGTAAWILSKPVSRSAFVLAKFIAYAAGFLSLAIMLPSAIFYGQSLFLAGRAPELADFLVGVGVTVLHTLFYLALTLMLGTLFNTRGPIGGIAMGVLFAGFLLPNVLPQAAVLAFPWMLKDLAVGLVLGSTLPAVWPLPLVATALWITLFLGVALWRFGREEF
jgi:ABC-2 type transport system permease protein